MEGTLEDPLVKDPVPDDTEGLVRDIVIPNGVNGILEDHCDESGESGGDGSEREDTEEEARDKGEEEEDMREDEEEHVDKGAAVSLENNAENSSDQHDAVSEKEDEEREIVTNESKISESSDCISEENIVSAVSPKSHENEENVAEEEEEEEVAEAEAEEEEPEPEEPEEEERQREDDACKDDTNEAMEVDENTDNSDVECLDESVAEIHSENENDPISNENNETKNISGSSDDVQRINDSGENLEDSKLDSSSDLKICEENGSSLGSPDIEIMDSSRSNGHNSSQERAAKETPKVKKPRKQIDLSSITPRRSTRNIKRTSYIEKEPEEEVEDCSSDIEEIKPEDPLACIVDPSKDKENSKLKSPTKSNKTTIVVSDTKRLVEIAAGSKSSKGGKKEPTLVIIDTNSILSGRGGIPVSTSGSSASATGYGTKSSLHHHHHHHQQQQQQQQQQQHHHHQPQQHQHQHHHHHGITTSSAFSVMPMGHTQTIYPNMRTTITPVPMTSRSHQAPKVSMPMPQPTIPQQILPTLTDDMFVVEAPSFIVPYVYEKPPLKPLKDFVGKLEKGIAEVEREEEEERKRKKKLREEIRKSRLEAARDESEPEKSEKKIGGDEDDEDESEDEEDTVRNKNEIDADTVDLTERGTDDKTTEEKRKIPTYFDLPLGKFFMQIGVNLVQEFVQTDLLRTQKRKQGKHGTASAETQIAINSLMRNLEFSKENNEPFHLDMKKCEFCSFKTESALVMQHHLETPHMRNYAYKCNFCPLEVRSPHDILFHMEAEHNTRGRLERGPAFHQCPNCPFEDNQKGKLTRHILACAKKFRPERNLEPATDWEPPAKIPRLHRPRQVTPVNANALAMAMGAKGTQPLLPKLLPAPVMGRGRGRPPMQPRYSDLKSLRPGSGSIRQDNVASMMYRPTSSGLLVPTSYQFGSNQIFQVVGGSGTVTSGVTGVSSGSSGSSGRPTPIALVSNIIDSQSRISSTSSQNSASGKNPAAKLMSQPSISITPLPRSTSQTPISGSGSSSKQGGKNTFVICEICDGYIKDLEQLRNHMQWIHKVKIHPKMIYNRPPLNCQKCQFRFFTDQGLERHLLGSHGLVTSSMQEAANKGKDAGRCPACGRVYQWKLLNHVARDHGMTLKPAHLSYKCTVCTATFGMYKQFENHVYSAHSVVAKKVMDKKSTPSSPSSRSNDSLLKPLKINDEITIIPQPAKSTSRSSQGRGK